MSVMGAVSTGGLMRLMQSGDTALDVLRGNILFSAPSFLDDLRQQMRAHGVPVSKLLAAIDISKTYMYQLLRGERRAGRDVVLRIALALKLSVDEGQRLLTLSGNNALYPRIRRDAAIIFALSTGMSLAETEELLIALPERSLYF